MDKLVVTGGRPLRGRVRISGSKNSTLPLMAAALLGESPSTIEGVPDLRDIRTMAEVIRSLGADVQFDDSVMTIDPAGFSINEAPYDIVRKMRASVYVMGPMLARLGVAKVSMPGGCAIGPRPIDLHLKGFEGLGATVGMEAGNMVLEAKHLRGGEFSLSGTAGSSVGATCNVLMAAAMAEGKTTILGAAMEPDVVELAGVLSAMGAEIDGAGTPTINVYGVRSLRGIRHRVVADRIEAGTFLVAGAITSGEVTLENAPIQHMAATIEKLRDIGASVETVDGGLRVTGDISRFTPTHIQTSPYPGFATDMQAQFMALLAVVSGTSTIREGIYVDRFIHAAEMMRMGANIRVLQGFATIEGVPKLSGAPVMASDLRASAALVIAGLAAEGTTTVNRVYHIDRGYERIERKLSDLGADIHRVSDGEPDEPPTASA